MACVIPNRRREGDHDDMIRRKSVDDRSWLLGESGGCGGGAALINADPMTVHSSFRFSFCTQIELDSMSEVSASPSTTVLLVNLDKSRAKERKFRRIGTAVERSISPLANSLIRFSYGEIVYATANFSKDRVLGTGALSCVFKGRFGIWRRAMAIKKLNKEDKESAKAFSRELMIASSLHNPNIVPLQGFCMDPNEGLFLVYRFVSGGSLEHHLHEKRGKKKNRFALPWSVRYKVAIGIAEAIAYLHNGSERCVVHRDIKPSNILLSSNKTPKLCDFGLATWTSAPSVTFLCKTVKGTFGYLAPEYFQHGKVSDKTDVYAFGVVLLELLTGRKPIDSKTTRENNLISWAKPLLNMGEKGIKKLVDARLRQNSKDFKQISNVIQAAAVCINGEDLERPDINKIIAILRGKQEAMVLSKNHSLFGYQCVFQSLHSSDLKNYLADNN